MPSCCIRIHLPLFPVSQARKLQVISHSGSVLIVLWVLHPVYPCSCCPQVRHQHPPQSSLLTSRLVPVSSALPPEHPLHLCSPPSPSHTHAHTVKPGLPTSAAPFPALLPGSLVFATLTYLRYPEQTIPSHSSSFPLPGALLHPSLPGDSCSSVWTHLWDHPGEAPTPCHSPALPPLYSVHTLFTMCHSECGPASLNGRELLEGRN